MGARKRISAEQRKETSKTRYQAVMRRCPTSPRKMRLVTKLINGKEVNRALDILKYSPQEASRRLEKLLLSAIANWQSKNEGVRVEESNLYIKNVFVDGGFTLKRAQTAPQGRRYMLRKRSNHVTLVLDSMNKETEAEKTSE